MFDDYFVFISSKTCVFVRDQRYMSRLFGNSRDFLVFVRKAVFFPEKLCVFVGTSIRCDDQLVVMRAFWLVVENILFFEVLDSRLF